MIISEQIILESVERLTATQLRNWIESGCVQPRISQDSFLFTDADLARIRLLCLLQDEFNVDDEAMPIVLSLIDQIHGLRAALRHLASAVDKQPEPVRDEIAHAFRILDRETNSPPT